jgi:hypothetical protein
MTESQQSKRGWFRIWRKHRRARRQQFIERDFHKHEKAIRSQGRRMYDRSSPYQRSGPITSWSAGDYGDGGGGCGE